MRELRGNLVLKAFENSGLSLAAHVRIQTPRTGS